MGFEAGSNVVVGASMVVVVDMMEQVRCVRQPASVVKCVVC